MCRLIGTDAEEKALILVVADGAGSAAWGGLGAETACATFAAVVKMALETNPLLGVGEEVVRAWLAETRHAVFARADADGRNHREYASTFLAAVLRHDECAFIQIGDGVIVAQGTDRGGWSWVFWPDHGEYANVTSFLTDERAIEHAHIECGPRTVAEIALLTDGIERLVLSYAGKSVHEPFFERNIQAVQQWREPGESVVLSEALALYLSSPEIRERADDDVTLVLATRQPYAVEPPAFLSEDAAE